MLSGHFIRKYGTKGYRLRKGIANSRSVIGTASPITEGNREFSFGNRYSFADSPMPACTLDRLRKRNREFPFGIGVPSPILACRRAPSTNYGRGIAISLSESVSHHRFSHAGVRRAPITEGNCEFSRRNRCAITDSPRPARDRDT